MGPVRSVRLWWALCCGVLLLAAAGRAQAGIAPASCPVGAVPAATLLFPYFEVDLAGADHQTTLISVTNAGSHATLAHVVLWTDWGVPTLAFDVALAKDDVQTLNLRDVFAGVLPVTGGVAATNCTNPVTLPTLDAAAVAALRAQHTGQPNAQNRCSGSGRAGVDVAIGYLTIDAAQACSANIHYPSSNGYFAPGGTGIASNENLLVGDFFLVDSALNLAEGDEAVAIVADAARFGGRPATFYGAWIGHSGDDARAPLGTRYRARFLNGGAFTGGTDLVVWAEPSWAALQGVPCGDRPATVDPCQFLRYAVFDEAGAVVDWVEDRLVTEVAGRIAVGGADLPTATPFGFVDTENRVVPLCDIPIGPPPLLEFPLQSFVLALHSASGRFAVGLEAHRTADELCPP